MQYMRMPVTRMYTLRLPLLRCLHALQTHLSASVQGYAGDEQLGEALKGADVIIIPAGVPRKPGMTRDDLFKVSPLTAAHAYTSQVLRGVYMVEQTPLSRYPCPLRGMFSRHFHVARGQDYLCARMENIGMPLLGGVWTTALYLLPVGIQHGLLSREVSFAIGHVTCMELTAHRYADQCKHCEGTGSSSCGACSRGESQPPASALQ